MGPYCKFCQTRCFRPLPSKFPDNHVYNRILIERRITILATCPNGKLLDQEALGFNSDDINRVMEQFEKKTQK